MINKIRIIFKKERYCNYQYFLKLNINNIYNIYNIKNINNINNSIS